MDIAIVTGASSALGQAISRRLIQLGFRVYGLGGDYKDCSLQNVNFRPVSCDLANPESVESACRQIMEKEKGVCLIVNNAKYFGNSPLSEMDRAELERILRINLLCPLILVRQFGESLKSLQGYLIQLGAPTAEVCRGGAAGAAASGGLKWMGDYLFNELRQHGVRVCHISPEPNRVRDARVRIRKGARTEASIDPEAVAQAVEQIILSPFGNVVTELVLRPLRIDEPDQEPVVQLPYPEPQPVPYTVPREFIEAEEQLDEEEWKKNQERKRQRRAKKKAASKDSVPGKTDSSEPESPAGSTEKAPSQEKRAESDGSGKSRRRGGRKPRPPRVEVGFKKDPPPASEAAPEAKKATGDAPKVKEDPPAKKAARKAARKTARKAAKKAVKKTARKQPAKKAAPSTDNGNKTAK